MMDSAAWDRAYGAAKLEWAGEPHPLVASELSELPPGHAIELGCGEGRQALFVLGWDRDNAIGPAPRYSVAELTAAAGGLAVVRVERVRQAGSASAWDTLLVARNSREMA